MAVMPIGMFCLIFGSKVTLLRLTPPLTPIEKLCRNSPICAIDGKAMPDNNNMITAIIDFFLLIILFKIKFY